MLGKILSTAALSGLVASIFYVFGDSQASPKVRLVLMEPSPTVVTEKEQTPEETDVVSARDPSPAL